MSTLAPHQSDTLAQAQAEAIEVLASALAEDGTVMRERCVVACAIIGGTALAVIADRLDQIGYLIQDLGRR